MHKKNDRKKRSQRARRRATRRLQRWFRRHLWCLYVQTRRRAIHRIQRWFRYHSWKRWCVWVRPLPVVTPHKSRLLRELLHSHRNNLLTIRNWEKVVRPAPSLTCAFFIEGNLSQFQSNRRGKRGRTSEVIYHFVDNTRRATNAACMMFVAGNHALSGSIVATLSIDLLRLICVHARMHEEYVHTYYGSFYRLISRPRSATSDMHSAAQ